MNAVNQLQKAVNGKPQADPEMVAKVQFLKSLQGELDYAIPPAIKKVLTPDRMCRLAITAMRQVRNLNQCTFESIAGSLMVAAQLGLEPNTPLQQCFLIPRKNKDTGNFEATFQIGYQGMLELAYRTETVQSVTAKSVHVNDHFFYEEGLNDQLVHRPFLGGDRGEVYAYYAVIKFVSGGHAFDVASKADMVQHSEWHAPRDYKTNRITGPWRDEFDEMAKKTMIRRLFKFMRKSTDVIAKATLYDERVIDRDMVTNELRPRIELPYEPPISSSAASAGFDDIPDNELDRDAMSDPEPQPKPIPAKPSAKPAPKVKQKLKAGDMEVISETVGDPIEAPFDSEPAKPSERKTSSVATVVMDIEKWVDAAAFDHDRNGWPDLGDRQFLMGRIYQNFVEQGFVNPAAKGWFAWLNEIAKYAGDSEGAFQALEKANKVVLAEYAGIPDELPEADEMDPPAKNAEKPAEPAVETHGQRVAAIEDWMTKAVTQFAEKGISGFEKPADVLGSMYQAAASQGLVKGKNTGWRPRVTELAECKISMHKLTQIFAAHARWIIEDRARGDMADREPGSEG